MLNEKKVSLVILFIVTWLSGCSESVEETAQESAPAESVSVISKGGVSKGGADEDMMAHMRGQEGGGEAHARGDEERELLRGGEALRERDVVEAGEGAGGEGPCCGQARPALGEQRLLGSGDAGRSGRG